MQLRDLLRLGSITIVEWVWNDLAGMDELLENPHWHVESRGSFHTPSVEE